MIKPNLHKELKSLNNDFKEVAKELRIDIRENIKSKELKWALEFSIQLDMLNYCIGRINNLLKR